MKNSTNVRIIGALLRLLPTELAARLALRLFMTTRGRRLRIPDARRFSLEGGVTGWWWGSGPPVYLVHGWNGHAGQLAAFVPPLVAAGFRVVALDAPGHGASAGDRSSVAHMADALRDAAALIGAPHGIVAHSLGAAAAMLAVRRGMPAPERLVMVGPATRPSRYLRGFLEMLRAPEPMRAAFYAEIEAQLGVSAEEADIVPLPEIPLLLVHDTHDREVPHASAEALAETWPRATLYSTTGLGHRRVLGDSGVAELSARFLRGQPTVACACGGVATRGAWCDGCALDRELFVPAYRFAATA